VIAIAGVLALVALLAYAFLPAPVPVELAAVVRGPLRVTVDGEGTTRVKDRFVVSAPLTGLLHRIDLHPGDRTERGGVIARIEAIAPPLLDVRTRAQAEARVRAATAARARAEADRERARTALEFARKELERKRALGAEALIPAAELDAAELEVRTLTEALESARFNVQVAQFELEVARAALLRTREPGAGGAGRLSVEVRSPVQGQVLRVFQESAGVVATGTPLLELGDPSALEIVVDLLSTDAVSVRPDQEVLIEHWGGEGTLKGRVRLVEPSGFTKVSALGVEEQRVNVVVDFVGPPETWQSLGDGYRVEARIVVWERADALKVPASALFRYGERWAAFVVADGRAHRRLVDVGRQSDVEAEVLGGLAEGERVILHPSDRIDGGVAVRPVPVP
jgi:HlyD family secretion protein